MQLRDRHVHLLGIGGAGLSALAELLLDRGAVVSGCDVAPTAVTERLLAHGA
ncbi:MAG: UDP-N-acetylmuramate--L-alanine ligase, partial [Candidatus Dormibacteraeota bacterium]|nr:UDP-N-acetylmuramate--L-alanine ligase [Candidatus Dormibacteraeota bacterium]